MLDAKSFSAMSEEGFATWLAPFGLSQDCVIQCLELGQVALERRKADAATVYRFTSGMSAGGLGMSSPKSLDVGSEDFAWLNCLAPRPD